MLAFELNDWGIVLMCVQDLNLAVVHPWQYNYCLFSPKSNGVQVLLTSIVVIIESSFWKMHPLSYGSSCLYAPVHQ